ncbi:hypothetical protein C8R45DRAFT_942589 [Mycena sanguinolenta]|nr:hypothetical protein C8R45DRAFT_942589 [Mycena sanguinolenta]
MLCTLHQPVPSVTRRALRLRSTQTRSDRTESREVPTSTNSSRHRKQGRPAEAMLLAWNFVNTRGERTTEKHTLGLSQNEDNEPVRHLQGNTLVARGRTHLEIPLDAVEERESILGQCDVYLECFPRYSKISVGVERKKHVSYRAVPISATTGTLELDSGGSTSRPASGCVTGCSVFDLEEGLGKFEGVRGAGEGLTKLEEVHSFKIEWERPRDLTFAGTTMQTARESLGGDEGKSKKDVTWHPPTVA